MTKLVDREGDWDFHLRSLSANARDSTAASDPASDPYILQSITKIYEICKETRSEDLVARAYPHINKLFHRSVAALPQSQTSNGLLLLTILQFFLDFGEMVLHDADPSLRTFFRSCLSREFADPRVAEATLDFLYLNKIKLINAYPTLLPQFFPLLLKLIAWNGEKLEDKFQPVLPAMMSNGSFLPLFPSLIDLPILVVTLEKVERGSGTLLGSSIASIQKSAAPEMLLALMDEAYTGSTIGDRSGDSGSEESNSIDVADPVFLDLLKDENDGLVERHWTSPGMTTALQAAINSSQSDRLKQALNMTPRFLSLYFAVALRDVNDSLVCALIPIIMARISIIFPEKNFAFEVRKRLSDFILAAFQGSPHFIALLKKPIVDRLGEVYDSPIKTELALNLCWAIGEHAAGGASYKDVARELFESLELLLYENLSISRLGLSQESGFETNGTNSRSSQVRLLCFVITAIAKQATCHTELLPRAQVALAKVARSRGIDRRVWQRASDYLGLLNEPAISLSILGPSIGKAQSPGTVNWSEGGSKMVSHVPFYILSAQEGKYYLVDGGYSTKKGFISPYRATRYHLKEFSSIRPTDYKELFNLRHSSLRTTVERAFGSLKNRFSIIKCDPYFPFQTQVDIILVCCILHNWIITEGGDDFILTEDEWGSRGHVTRRDEIVVDDSREWLEKRDQIANAM